jgi:hypothetical protein
MRGIRCLHRSFSTVIGGSRIVRASLNLSPLAAYLVAAVTGYIALPPFASKLSVVEICKIVEFVFAGQQRRPHFQMSCRLRGMMDHVYKRIEQHGHINPTVNIAGNNAVAVMFDSVVTFTDDVALNPFSNRWLLSVVSQLIVDERVVRKKLK